MKFQIISQTREEAQNGPKYWGKGVEKDKRKSEDDPEKLKGEIAN